LWVESGIKKGQSQAYSPPRQPKGQTMTFTDWYSGHSDSIEILAKGNPPGAWLRPLFDCAWMMGVTEGIETANRRQKEKEEDD